MTVKRLRILVIDDEPAIRQVLANLMQREGHAVEHAGDGEGGLALLASGEFDVCICDMRLPGISGLDVLQKARESNIATTFVMITAFATLNSAVDAMKLGAYDYLVKPIRHEDVLNRLSQISRVEGLTQENRRLRQIVASHQPHQFNSQSPAMVEVEKLAAKVARTRGTVLITGNSGTGKTFIARRIHEMSPRSSGPFVTVNCGAIPETLIESEFFGHVKGAFTGAGQAKKGLFWEANGGTLLLDEVFELPLALQVKLLHVLEDEEIRPVGSDKTQKVDVRIVAATNRDVERMVESGEFREDLFYRLNVLHIQLPSLSARLEDLPELLRFFLDQEARRLGIEPSFQIDPAAEEVLLGYAWAGNLREMQNVVARMLVLADSDIIGIADLPARLTQRQSGDGQPTSERREMSLRNQVRRYELKLIQDAVATADGDRQVAARNLGIGLSTLYRKLEETTH